MIRFTLATCILIALGFCIIQPVAAQDLLERCAMCHRAKAQDPVPKHPNCLMCHREAEDHAKSPRREKPAEITIESCQMCHRPTEAFTANYHHSQNLNCQTCHAAHDE